MSIGIDRFQKGLCAKCGNKREPENDTIWCYSCIEKERENHTTKLSED